MLQYAICEIGGKQFLVEPGKPLLVDYQGDILNVEAKVLLRLEDGKLEIGKPYLNKTLKLDSLQIVKKDKIRVAKFHHKANFRRVTGIRPKLTEVVYKA